MKNLMTLAFILAACAVSAEPAKAPVSPLAANIPGLIPVTIKPGTNVVENLPFTANMLPFVQSFYMAKPGDTFVWKGETHTFDGKTWSGKDGGNALVPIHESFTIIRTANATDIWNVGGEIDYDKAIKQEQQKQQKK